MPRTSISGVDGILAGVRAAAFDRLGACAVVLDHSGTILDTNASWRLFTQLNQGHAGSTGAGVNYLAVCDRSAAAGVADADEVADGLRQILKSERERMDFEYPCPSPTEDCWFLVQASAAPVVDGTGAVVFHVDGTARKMLADRLAVLADDDGLTGLPNRRSAERYLDEQLMLAHATGGSLWVHFIDLNGFKAVNDQYGHHVGDELLCKVAIRARSGLRAEDLLCRFGGDEFVLICPGLDRGGAVQVADRLRMLMSEPFQIDDIEVMGRVSVGFAGSQPESTVESLIGAADQDMYIDKRAVSARNPSSGLPVDRRVAAGAADLTGRRWLSYPSRALVTTSAFTAGGSPYWQARSR